MSLLFIQASVFAHSRSRPHLIVLATFQKRIVKNSWALNYEPINGESEQLHNTENAHGQLQFETAACEKWLIVRAG